MVLELILGISLWIALVWWTVDHLLLAGKVEILELRLNDCLKRK